MPFLHQYDYLFAFGTIFAFLDAFNIGANDVANSFATSVSSKSLTLKQACFAAAICEFSGAVLVGARVSSTIKNSIIELDAFRGNPGVQLLGFTCALIASATWLMIATRYSMPVSTTYSIVSAVAGVGIAIGGVGAVEFGYNEGKGLASIFAGFIIAPGIAACFGAIVFLLTKYLVLQRKDSVRAGLIASPFYFFGVAAIMTLSIVYKGAPNLKLDKLSSSTIAASIVGTSAVVSALSILFWLPYVYAKVVRNDYTVRFYHIFIGPILWKREPPSDAHSATAESAVPDYRVYKEENQIPAARGIEPTDNAEKGHDDNSSDHGPRKSVLNEQVEHGQFDGTWFEPKNIWIVLRYKSLPFIKKVLTHGTNVDVHALQAGEGTTIARRMTDMHSRAKQFDNKTEHLYSFLQVMTACTASFAHGSNDVANAIGPYSAIYYVWSTGTLAGSTSDVPIYLLVFGGAGIVIGLATYGYNIMRILGNRLTLHSPSRGFSMELGSAITVLLASTYGLPVSTTMCITGSTIGVALCNGDLRAFNWRALTWIIFGWIVTVPIAGVAAGCLMGIMLNSPHF